MGKVNLVILRKKGTCKGWHIVRNISIKRIRAYFPQPTVGRGTWITFWTKLIVEPALVVPRWLEPGLPRWWVGWSLGCYTNLSVIWIRMMLLFGNYQLSNQGERRSRPLEPFPHLRPPGCGLPPGHLVMVIMSKIVMAKDNRHFGPLLVIWWWS